MKFKKINCPICNKNYSKRLFETNDFRLHTTFQEFNLCLCKNCGFVYVNPQPNEDELGKFYPESYYNPTPLILEFFYKPFANMITKKMIGDIKKVKRNGKLLDVGCGSGFFLKELLKYGYDAYGIDSYEGILDIISPELCLRVKNNSFLDIKFPDESFDIVIIKQVLEHLLNPNDVIKEIHRILKEDGIVYVEVPNFNCAEAQLFGKFWYNLEVPRHLYQFTKKTFRAIFEKNGFSAFLELNNNGSLLLKSPLAIVNSFNFFLRNKIKRNLPLNLINVVCFLPLLIITLFLRIFSGKEGMDIRMIFTKNK
ncbi:MAG: class I SAM-dependent methyltransferase [bacterium]